MLQSNSVSRLRFQRPEPTPLKYAVVGEWCGLSLPPSIMRGPVPRSRSSSTTSSRLPPVSRLRKCPDRRTFASRYHADKKHPSYDSDKDTRRTTIVPVRRTFRRDVRLGLEGSAQQRDGSRRLAWEIFR